MHWGGSYVPVGIVQFIIVFALKLSSSLLLFQPIIVLFVAISFASCRHFKGMLFVEILHGKGLLSIFFIVTHKQGSLQTKSDTVLYMQYGAVLHSH